MPLTRKIRVSPDVPDTSRQASAWPDAPGPESEPEPEVARSAADPVPGLQAPPEPALRGPYWWRRWRLMLALAVIAGVGAWLLSARPWVQGPAPVIIELVETGPVTQVLAVNGRIAPLRSVAVRSTVAGTLVSPMPEEGAVVAQGDILARLDDAQQRAVVRQSRAALEQAVVTQRQARDAVVRDEALGANIPRVVLDDARRALERADQEVGRLTALIDQAEHQLSGFSIVAPMDGTVLTRGVEPGQVVDLSSPLFTLADLSELVVEADVDESFATRIRTDMPALLQLTGDAGTLSGHVSFIAPLVDAATGGLAIKIAFDDPVQAPVGLTVTANIIVDQRDAALSAPRTAITSVGSDSAVFLLSDGTARLTPVEVIDWPAERLIVTGGLNAGDRLIVDAEGLVDGQRVTLSGSQ